MKKLHNKISLFVESTLFLNLKISDGKKNEISLGVDGFLIYDLKFLPCLQRLSTEKKEPCLDQYTVQDLLAIPKGKVTLNGLKKNIKVGILFIASWLTGNGTFILDGSVEDSATAEISRFQVWQWIKHQQVLDSNDQKNVITLNMVKDLSKDILEDLDDPQKHTAHDLFIKLVQATPQFITTWLNNTMEFRKYCK